MGESRLRFPTMQLNSLIPFVCLLLVSACQSLGLEGLKEQKAREGKKQVGLPCKTIVTEECTEKEVPRFEEVCEWYKEMQDGVREALREQQESKAGGAAGGPAHLSHRLSEHGHDHGGALQGPLLQLSDHDVPAQP